MVGLVGEVIIAYTVHFYIPENKGSQGVCVCGLRKSERNKRKTKEPKKSVI